MLCAHVLLLTAMVLPLADPQGPFAFREVNATGLQLSDAGKPVFVYNFGMMLGKNAPESLRRSSYLHPVYAPSGAVLTDDFNPNHPHHRGIFWAWTDVTVGGKKGDMWTVKGPFQDRFVAWKARETNEATARLAVENGWYDADRKFLKEDVEILTHRVVDNQRVLQITLRFEAAEQPVQIVGTSQGKKGFSGFCFKFAAPDGGKPVIRTDAGLSPKDGVLARHPWAQLSGTFQGQPAGARVEDDASNPGYPHNGWLMRHQLCCLNVCYPGLQPVTLEPGKPLTLKYKVVLFSGAGPDGAIGRSD
jgi:hypothetical protein